MAKQRFQLFKKKEVKEEKTKALVKHKQAEKEIQNLPIQEKEIVEWLDATGLSKRLLPAEKLQFLKIAKCFGLNPFRREIFLNVYNEKKPDERTISIVIGYTVFLKRAERIQILDGWGCITVGKIPDLKAVLTIYRKDRKFPFIYEVDYEEVVQRKHSGEITSFWRKMPKFMTKKVCISQGFRMCFPDELGGLPYTDAERGEDQEYAEPINVTDTKNTKTEDSKTIESDAELPEYTELKALLENRMLKKC